MFPTLRCKILTFASNLDKPNMQPIDNSKKLKITGYIDNLIKSRKIVIFVCENNSEYDEFDDSTIQEIHEPISSHENQNKWSKRKNEKIVDVIDLFKIYKIKSETLKIVKLDSLNENAHECKMYLKTLTNNDTRVSHFQKRQTHRKIKVDLLKLIIYQVSASICKFKVFW